MWCAARHCAFESHPLRQKEHPLLRVFFFRVRVVSLIKTVTDPDINSLQFLLKHIYESRLRLRMILNSFARIEFQIAFNICTPICVIMITLV